VAAGHFEARVESILQKEAAMTDAIAFTDSSAANARLAPRISYICG
jgi:hypothetical protein